MNTVSKWLMALALLAPVAALAERYTVTDLGTLGGIGTVGNAINASGQITGWSGIPIPLDFHAFLYSDGAMQDLGTPAGTTRSIGSGINASGQVTGSAEVTQSLRQAFLYTNGAMQSLDVNVGTLGGTNCSGSGINSRGQVTGSGGNPYQVHAFVYSNGTTQDLGTLGGTNSGGAGINARGHVTGASDDGNTDPAGNPQQHAFLYSNGTMKDLGTLGGTDSYGAAINDSSQVTGWAYTTGGATHAFLYSNGAMKDLGTLGGTTSSGASINATGQVTGEADTAVGGSAFLYDNGKMTDLNSLISRSAQELYTLTGGNAINDRGQIVAGASVNGAHPAQNTTLLLTPIPIAFDDLLKDVRAVAPHLGRALALEVETAHILHDVHDRRGSCATLEGFVAEVQGLDGTTIDQTFDARLITNANAIEAAIDCE